MKWIICGTATALAGVCLMVAAIASTPKAPVQDVIYDFNFLEGTPNVVTNDPSPVSFDFLAMTEQQGLERLSDWETTESTERPRRVLFFTQKSCVWCQLMLTSGFPKMVDSGWLIGPSPLAHIQIVDVDANPKLAAMHNVKEVPVFVRIVNGQVETRHEGLFGGANPIPVMERVKLLAEFYSAKK